MRVQRNLQVIAWMATLLVCGCLPQSGESNGSSGSGGGWSHRVQLPADTQFDVRLSTTLSSETATTGDRWEGTVARAVFVHGDEVVAAGSTVRGVVSDSRPAARGSRAMLDLAVESVETGGRTIHVAANTEQVIAGSTRARNLGAIAGGTAAGALIGKAVGGDGHDALVGGILGGAAATGAVAASKGYQVVLKPGTVMTFTVREAVAVRLDR